mgnify:CR=1 FL=1
MDAYLIVGLGNPGSRYVANRHNVGFRCVERLAVAHGLSFKRRKQARVALGTIYERRVILVKPQTFMNESGRAVAPLVHFYRLPLERLLLVYDDLDLPLGTIRLRPAGGSGGHRGVRSVIEHLGSQDFPRLRIGISRPPEGVDPADYVLQDFAADEEPIVDVVLERAVAAIETWIREGIEAAMNRYN